MKKSNFTNSWFIADTNNPLVEEFENTRNLSNGKYKKETAKAKKDTVVYDKISNRRRSQSGVSVEFIADGTVSAGYALSEDYHTAILNFADAITPGGLVAVGGTTQEENICRCSNLYESITIGDCIRDYYRANSKNGGSIYLDRLIYSKNILVFKDDVNYNRISPRYLDVITCPAPSAFIKNDKTAYNIYKRRIKKIVLSAIENKADCIVLGAWGCGAFCQDPRLVSKAFVDVLNDYSGFFERVVFAIRPTPGMRKQNNSTTDVFLKAFKDGYKWGVENGIR